VIDLDILVCLPNLQIIKAFFSEVGAFAEMFLKGFVKKSSLLQFYAE